MITTGTLNAADVTITNLNASNITTGTLSASKVLFADGSALTTASRIQTAFVNNITGTATADNTDYALTNASWSATAASTADTFNIDAALVINSNGMTASVALIYFDLYVDGVLQQSQGCYVSQYANTAYPSFPYITSLTGLSAGAHTIALYLKARAASGVTSISVQSGYARLQRIY
jgi:hypothetical protein